MVCCSNKKIKSKAKKIDGQLCYCFNYKEKDFQSAIENNREQILIEEIKSKMINPGCFCETSNPTGKCCLNDIKNFINQVRK